MLEVYKLTFSIPTLPNGLHTYPFISKHSQYLHFQMDFIPNLLYPNYHSYCESYALSDDMVPCRLLLHG